MKQNILITDNEDSTKIIVTLNLAEKAEALNGKIEYTSANPLNGGNQ